MEVGRSGGLLTALHDGRKLHVRVVVQLRQVPAARTTEAHAPSAMRLSMVGGCWVVVKGTSVSVAGAPRAPALRPPARSEGWK